MDLGLQNANRHTDRDRQASKQAGRQAKTEMETERERERERIGIKILTDVQIDRYGLHFRRSLADVLYLAGTGSAICARADPARIQLQNLAAFSTGCATVFRLAPWMQMAGGHFLAGLEVGMSAGSVTQLDAALKAFSHVWVIFLFDQNRHRSCLRVCGGKVCVCVLEDAWHDVTHLGMLWSMQVALRSTRRARF